MSIEFVDTHLDSNFDLRMGEIDRIIAPAGQIAGEYEQFSRMQLFEEAARVSSYMLIPFMIGGSDNVAGSTAARRAVVAGNGKDDDDCSFRGSSEVAGDGIVEPLARS